MRKTCKDCKARFEVDLDELEEGDYTTCPECNLEYTLIAQGNDPTKITLIESKKLALAEDEEDLLLDDGEDYDSD